MNGAITDGIRMTIMTSAMTMTTMIRTTMITAIIMANTNITKQNASIVLAFCFTARDA